MGFSSIAPSNTSIAQTVWSYGPRTLTDIQNMVVAIQNNNPNVLATLGDLFYIPAPYYNGQVSMTQVAAFVNKLVQNYNAAGIIASFINSDPFSLWHMDFVTNLIQSPYLGFTNASQILSAASTSALASIATSTNVPVTTILALISNAALSATAAQGLLYGLAHTLLLQQVAPGGHLQRAHVGHLLNQHGNQHERADCPEHNNIVWRDSHMRHHHVLLHCAGLQQPGNDSEPVRSAWRRWG
jgi:hypothetical protein